jgi:steroid 5-alpha reductase family enzyme
MPSFYGIVTLLEYPSPRVLLMTVLVSIWGLRLSYNFWRKGGYSLIPWKGEEDYRWSVLRQKPALKGRFRFGIFNLLFISFYQHFLILLFSSPFIIAAMHPEKGLNYLDIAASVLMLAFILTETIADNQLYRFHKLKKNPGLSPGEYTESIEKGFFTEGLWKYSRHPNFLSEQAIWASFYIYSVAASGMWLNWSMAGAVLLILLFAGSSTFTERISSGKYPAYADYRKRVPRFLPRIFRYKAD